MTQVVQTIVHTVHGSCIDTDPFPHLILHGVTSYTSLSATTPESRPSKLVECSLPRRLSHICKSRICASNVCVGKPVASLHIAREHKPGETPKIPIPPADEGSGPPTPAPPTPPPRPSPEPSPTQDRAYPPTDRAPVTHRLLHLPGVVPSSSSIGRRLPWIPGT